MVLKFRALAVTLAVAAAVVTPTGAFAASTDDVHGDTGSWGANDAAGVARIKQLQASVLGAARVGVSPQVMCPVSTPVSLLAQTDAQTAASCPGVPSYPTARTLPVGWQQQTTGYWCGPTTVSMASYYFGTNHSQSAAATKIGTTTNGSDRAQVTNGMNWARNTPGFYAAISAPSSATIITALKSDIGISGSPFAVNTHELVNGAHYNAHPNRDIGHFVLAVGYTANATTAVINDPAAGLSSGYGGSAAQFSITTSSLATFVDDRGIVA